MTTLLIKNGTLVNADRMWKGDIFVQGEKIAKIGDNLADKADRVIDATGKYVIPGGIDTHTHMQLPFMGTVAVDDFNHGTRAGIAGGTTFFLDFVIPQKGESLLKAYKQWREWADPKVNCDYSFHVAVTWWSEEVAKEMEILVKEHGVNSFKMFMAYKGVFQLNDEEMYHAMTHCKKLGALAQVHAENGDIVYEGQKKMIEMGITGPEGHLLSRPEDVEGEATNRAIMIADRVNTPLYVVHVMCKEAADAVVRGRNSGKIVFGEPIAAGLGTDGCQCFHESFRHASAFVMGPPLRPDPTVKTYLMKLLSTGDLQTVGTDNCTFNGNQKAMGKDDFRKIPNGVNGIEDRLSIVWEKGVHAGLLTPQQFVAVTSTNAARIFGVYPQKGRLEVGSDADIVIWDGDKSRVISKETHHHAVDFNVFEGMTVHGVAEMTIVKGRVCWENNELKTINAFGKYVNRPAFAMPFEGIAQRDKIRDERQFKVNRND